MTPARTKKIDVSPEPADVLLSPSMGILEELDMHNTVASLEARMDSIEIDVARQQGSREDDVRRTTGEIAVMRARVEDALTAFAETADDLRSMAKDVDKRSGDRSTAQPNLDPFRAEVEAKIAGVTAGVGDVLEALATRIDDRLTSVTDRLDQLADRIDTVGSGLTGMGSVPKRVAALEEMVAELSAERRAR